jgi:dephospho-CoA kinase
MRDHAASYVVGLTGGIGSGKSVVAEAFARLGIEVVDTDLLAHQLSARGQPGFTAIRAAFGDEFILASGELDRTRLRQRVFADPAARRRLESVLHPLIGAEARRLIDNWRGPYGIVVVPLLLERGGLVSLVDRILVVDCSEQEQLRRVALRTGMSSAEIRAIMATQLDRSRRLAAADDILDNNGAPEAMALQVKALDQRYRRLAASARRSR